MFIEVSAISHQVRLDNTSEELTLIDIILIPTNKTRPITVKISNRKNNSTIYTADMLASPSTMKTRSVLIYLTILSKNRDVSEVMM